MIMFGLDPEGRNIFLITTPLQFILANLINSEFKLEAEFFVLTDWGRSLEQIDEVAKILGFDDYHKMFKPVSSTERNKFKLLYKEIVRYTTMLEMKKSLNSHDNVFVGLATSPINRPIVCGSNNYNLVFFDDGTATIRFLKQREAGKKEIEFPTGSWLHAYTRLYPRSIRLDRMTYFTIYPGLKGGTNDTVVRVRSKLPACLFEKKRKVEEVWFVGGPLVENRVIPDGVYVEILRNISEICKGLNLKFVYFPHRVEKWIYDELSEIEKRQPFLPWELFFARSEIAPKAIVSIISSVIINLSLLCEQVCPYVYVDLRYTERNSSIREVQDYAENILNLPVVRKGDLESMFQ